MSTHGVKYQTQQATYLGLFPGQCLDEATNQKQVDAYNIEMKKWKESNEKTEQPSAVAPLVPFEACLQNRISSNAVQWVSPATGKPGTMLERYRIKPFQSTHCDHGDGSRIGLGAQETQRELTCLRNVLIWNVCVLLDEQGRASYAREICRHKKVSSYPIRVL